MKVLFITHYSTLYGANRSMLGLAEDMIERYGIDVYIICPKKGNIIERANYIGAHVSCFPYISWRAERFCFIRRIVRKIINPFIYIFICSYVRRVSPDVIHSNSSVTDLGVALAESLDTPCVWHLREFGEEDYNLKYLVSDKKIERYYAKAKSIVAVSEYLKKYYLDKYSEIKIDVVYNGITSIDVKKEIHEGCNFCIVGKITEKKGQFDCIKAIKRLACSFDSGFHLYIVGDGKRKYVSILKSYIKKNNIEKYISFIGYSDNVAQILGNMDVGILASDYEAFGRVTVEYASAELFVIASDKGGTKEIIGDNALYYKYGDYVTLAEQMKYCIDNSDLVKSNLKKIKNYVDQKFSQDVCTDSIMKIYKDLA